MSTFQQTGFFFLGFLWSGLLPAQTPPPQVRTLRVTTQLVVLDATVLDRHGNIVGQPLTRGDFQIEEDRRAQTIYSFESVSDHVRAMADGDAEKSPLVIFVLDELNYAYQPSQTSGWNTAQQVSDYVFERTELTKFLEAQPEQLHQRTEVLVLTHHGYRVLSEPTQDRGWLLERLRHHDPGLGSPFRDYLEETGGGNGGVADFTSTKSSMEAVWSLALAERSLPGRKLVVWLGYGGPLSLASTPPKGRTLTHAERSVREITDLLVDARITLDIVGPGISVEQEGPSIGVQQLVSYRFESDFGFSGFVAASGGRWQNGNDLRGEIAESANYGTSYYTLAYHPTNRAMEGGFRRIKVSVKGHPEWTVLTKGGYYASQFGGEADEAHEIQSDLSMATFEAMPFSAIGVSLEKVERLQDSDSARFTFRLDSTDLQWLRDLDADGKRTATVALSGACLGSVFDRKPPTARVVEWELHAPVAASLDTVHASVSLILPVGPKTRRLRFVVRDTRNGRMGTAEVNPAMLANAPVIDRPAPLPLQPRSDTAVDLPAGSDTPTNSPRN